MRADRRGRLIEGGRLAGGRPVGWHALARLQERVGLARKPGRADWSVECKGRVRTERNRQAVDRWLFFGCSR